MTTLRPESDACEFFVKLDAVDRFKREPWCRTHSRLAITCERTRRAQLVALRDRVLDVQLQLAAAMKGAGVP